MVLWTFDAEALREKLTGRAEGAEIQACTLLA
jgi:hypothetical protein